MNSSHPGYSLLLKNERILQYDRMANLFMLLNMGLLIYVASTINGLIYRVTAGSAAGFVILLLLFRLFSQKEKDGTWLLLTSGLVICAAWIVMGKWLPGLLCPAIMTLYILSRRKLVVMISKERIIFPSFPQKQISWSDLQSVILKDGLLTLNFKSDRFIQQSVDAAGPEVDDREFNEFCRQQLVS